jgi:hypothetical protein
MEIIKISIVLRASTRKTRKETPGFSLPVITPCISTFWNTLRPRIKTPPAPVIFNPSKAFFWDRSPHRIPVIRGVNKRKVSNMALNPEGKMRRISDPPLPLFFLFVIP